IQAAALGASESSLPDTATAQALHTFTLDTGASRCFFRDSTTLTPLPTPDPVRLADPSRGPLAAHSSTVLPCLAVPSSSLLGIHLPSFSTKLVSTAALQDSMVTTTTPRGSSLCTLATEPPQVVASAQVPASGLVAPACSCPPPVPRSHAMALRPCYVPLRVPLPAPPESSLPAVPDRESDHARAASPIYFSASPPSIRGECALGTDVLEDNLEDFECLAAAVPHFASMMLAPEGDPDALDIPTPRSYAKAITCPYSAQWQTAMDPEMESWKFTGTYVDAVPPSRANIVDGMWIFRALRKWHDTLRTTLAALGFTPSTADPSLFLRTDTPLPPFYVLVYIDDLVFATAGTEALTLVKLELQKRHTCTDLGPSALRLLVLLATAHSSVFRSLALSSTFGRVRFTPSTADPSLFLRTDTPLPPFYVLVYIDDLVFATAGTEALTLVKLELQKRHTCTDLDELRSYLGLQITRDRARRTITLTQSHMVHQSVEPSGPYPELVGCLMYLTTFTRPDLAYPLSLLACYVAPVRRAWGSCLEDGVQLFSPVTQTLLGSSCEAEIYAGAMAVQELHWLTYLLTDLGEQPRSPPERGQLCLAYVATRANTADIFTKALLPSDHQRFSTVLACFAFLNWSCDHLFSPTLPMG
ncbi:unnamed protein product, partial [Closterium sp. NIES-53]